MVFFLVNNPFNVLTNYELDNNPCVILKKIFIQAFAIRHIKYAKGRFWASHQSLFLLKTAD